MPQKRVPRPKKKKKKKKNLQRTNQEVVFNNSLEIRRDSLRQRSDGNALTLWRVSWQMPTNWMGRISQSCLSKTCFLWPHVGCLGHVFLRHVIHDHMPIPNPFYLLSCIVRSVPFLSCQYGVDECSPKSCLHQQGLKCPKIYDRRMN